MLALLACLSLSAQTPPAKVSFYPNAAPAGKVVAELAKTLGVKMFATKEMNKEIIFVDVNDVPTEDLLQRIARVSSAKWLKENNQYTLVEDDQKRKQERQEELQLRVQLIRNRLQVMVDPANAPKYDGAIPFDAPREQFMAALLSQLDINQLAEMGDSYQRVVFSTKPTPMQRPISVDAEALKTFVDDQNHWLVVTANSLANGSDQGSENSEALLQQQIPGLPDRVVIRLSILNPYWRVPWAETDFIDANDRATFHRSTNLVYRRKPTLAKENRFPLEPEKKPFRFSLAAHLLSRFVAMSIHSIDPQVLQQLTRPDEFEPLSFTVGDPLASIASNFQRNIVADVPDACLFRNASGGAAPFLNGLIAGSMIRAKFENSWIEVAPARPDVARRDRLDRSELTEFIRQMQSPAPHLAAYEYYANAVEEPGFHSAENSYFVIFGDQPEIGPVEFGVLRFMTSLDSIQNNAFANGGTLSLQQLNQYQAGIVEWLLFGPGARLDDGKHDATEKNWLETTEVFPNGLPSNCAVQLSSESKEAVRPVESGDADLDFASDPDGLAALSSTATQFQLGKFVTLRLSILPASGYKAEYPIFYSIPSEGPLLNLDQLPKRWRDAVVESRKHPAGSGGG